MSKSQITAQETFWKVKFCSDYISRHETQKWVKNNTVFFKRCLKSVNKRKLKTLIEFGSNVGLNLMALNDINKFEDITAIEINKKAYANLTKLKYVNPINQSALEYSLDKKYDLVLSKGFLIHINPKKLNLVYDKIFNSCKKSGYILICEYYSQNPVSVNYRGNKNMLFKRDFAGEIIKKYKNTTLIDYGFVYRNDKFPQDDMNWFLIKKL